MPAFDAGSALRWAWIVVDEVELAGDAPRQQKAVRDAALLRESIQEFPGPVAVYDEQDRLIACNALYRWVHGEAFDRVERAAAPAGLRYEDLVRESAKQVVPPEALEAHVADRLRAQREASGEPVDRYYPERGWFRIVKIRTPSGAVAGFATDVTELKELTLALEQARAAAEAANLAKSSFLANMSHELRTPLNAIIGMAEALDLGVLGALENPRHRQYVADIRGSGEHLLALLSDLLDLAKVEAGAMELEREVFELAALLRECEIMMTPLARRAPVRLAVTRPEPSPRLFADRRKIKQVLINILSNAVKYSRPGGLVELAARPEDGGLAIVVLDQGIGVDEAQIELAFRPFSRLAGETRNRAEGAGLGLPLARRFAELHGGTLRIAARRGAGTRVTLWLPPEALDGAER